MCGRTGTLEPGEAEPFDVDGGRSRLTSAPMTSNREDGRPEHAGGSSGRPRRGSVKASLVIELEGSAPSVFRQGSSLLHVLVDELTVAKMARVHVEYGEASTTEHVVDGAGGLELSAQEADRDAEMRFWALVVQASAVSAAHVVGGTEEPS